MKKIAPAILIFFMIINGQNILAQNLKFGHINSEELIQALPEFDSAKVKFEKFRKELQTHLEAMSSELNIKYETYLKESKNLNAIIRQNKEQELSDIERRIQEFQTSAQTQLQEKQVELFQPIYAKVDKAIKDVGTENGFFYIFDTPQGGQLLYFDESKSTNITALARAKLNLK